MERIESKVQPGKLLHLVVRREDAVAQRNDWSPAEEGLQVASFRLGLSKTFRPHEHVPRPREIPITQETWVVADGAVKATYYDLDGTVLAKHVLFHGDCTITLAGGHSYLCTSPALVYEVKTGPFVGVEQDKKYLDGE